LRLLITVVIAVAVVAALAWALDIGGRHYRRQTVAGLRQANNIRGLESKLKHGDILARADAVDALMPEGEKAFAAIRSALSDRSDVVRERAAGALGQIGDPAAVPDLIATLNGPVRDPARDQYVRVAAVRALARLGGDDAINAIITTMKDGNAEDWVRREAVDAAAATGDKRLAPALREAMRDRIPQIRSVAAHSYASVAGKEAVPVLIDLLRTEKDPYVRRTAVQMLAQLNDPRAVPALTNSLKDSEPAVVLAAAEALVSVGGPKGVDVLVTALQAPIELERLAAATVLANRLDPRAVPTLQALLRSQERLRRNSALISLGKMGRLARPAAPAIRKALKDKEPQVRETAKNTLALVQGGAAAPAAPASPPTGGMPQ